MAVYLKMEETIVDSNSSLRDDVMGLSLLALLLSPWAAVGLAASMFEYVSIPSQASVISVLVLMAATPKFLQLLITHDKHCQQEKTL